MHCCYSPTITRLLLLLVLRYSTDISNMLYLLPGTATFLCVAIAFDILLLAASVLPLAWLLSDTQKCHRQRNNCADRAYLAQIALLHYKQASDLPLSLSLFLALATCAGLNQATRCLSMSLPFPSPSPLSQRPLVASLCSASALLSQSADTER